MMFGCFNTPRELGIVECSRNMLNGLVFAGRSRRIDLPHAGVCNVDVAFKLEYIGRGLAMSLFRSVFLFLELEIYGIGVRDLHH